MLRILKRIIIDFFRCFLQATLITLGVQVYEILRPKFPQIVEIMQQIPNTNVADIQKLDEKILSGAQSKGKIDKYKKDLFKKITAQVIKRSSMNEMHRFFIVLIIFFFIVQLQLIGKNIGQLFRKEAIIANLRPMINPNANTYTSLLDSNNETNIVTQLFSTNS